MKQTSDRYKAAVIANPRRVTPFANMDFSDPDAQYGNLAGAEMLPFCSQYQLYDRKIYTEKSITSLEPRLALLDGSRELPKYGQKEAAEIGITLDVMCGRDCIFPTGAYIELPISGVQTLQAMTLAFADDPVEGWPVEYTVQLKIGDGVVWQKSITDGKPGVIKFDGFTVYDPTAVKIIFQRWSWPCRRARILEICLGIFEEWTGADMYEVDVIQQTDFTNLTIAYDTAKIVIRNDSRRFHPRAKDSIFDSIEARQPVKIVYGVCQPGDRPERVPVGVFYLKEKGWETAATDSSFEMNFVSIIGLLAARVPKMPETLPTKLSDWAELILGTIGDNFTMRYIIAPELAEVELSASAEDLQGMTCGDLLRYLCMAAGGFYSADPVTGNLCISAIPQRQGTYIGLNQQFAYPVESQGEDYSDIVFKLAVDELYTIGGNASTAEKSCKVDNPFIRTKAAADIAAKNILRQCGGSVFQIAGRGDPACEIGDIDTFEAIGERVSARRYRQQLKISNGVMQLTPSWLIQTSWGVDFAARVEKTSSGSWTAPEGVTKIRLVLIGAGESGENGKNGKWSADGTPGAGGAGGLVWVGDVNVTPGGVYAVNVAADSSQSTRFGTAYSSAFGKRYTGGWGDIYTGKAYAAEGEKGKERCTHQTDGADAALGSGCGGQGGGGGRQGVRAWTGDSWVYKRSPVDGGAGGAGGSGCVIIYY